MSPLSLPSHVAVAAWPFLFGFGLSLGLVPLARRLATRFGYVAAQREDRWHRRPVALLGGVAVALTVAIGLLVFGGGWRAIGVLLGSVGVMFVTGLVDDLRSLRPSTKLVVQIAVASVLLSFGFRLNWTVSLTLDTMLTLVWVVGMINAFNLLDNMDGLCGGLALIVGAALLVQMGPAVPATEVFFKARYLALLLGATAGFLVYNVSPASIFLGDSGSLLLGTSFAALTLGRAREGAATSDPLSIVAVPVLLLLIPIFDTALVTASRMLSGRSPAEGGRDHSSHRLVAIGLSERAAVAVLWGLAAIGGGLGVAFDHLNVRWTGVVAALFVIAMVLFAVFLARVRVYESVEPEAIDRSAVTPLVANFMYKRRVLEVLLDMALISIAYYSSYRLRFEGVDFDRNFSVFYRSLPLVLSVQLVALFLVGTYRGVWRYFGLMDTVGIAKGVLLGTVAAVPTVLFVFRFEQYSRTVFVIDAMLLAILLTASRVSFQLIGEFVNRNRTGVPRAVVYGAGDGGALVVREFTNSARSPQMIGFIDDDPRKLRSRVQGYPVLGPYDALVSLVSTRAVDMVVIATELSDPARLEHLQALCAEHRVSLTRLLFKLDRLIVAS